MLLPTLDANLGLLSVCGLSSRLVAEDGAIVEDRVVMSGFRVVHVG